MFGFYQSEHVWVAFISGTVLLAVGDYKYVFYAVLGVAVKVVFYISACIHFIGREQYNKHVSHKQETIIVDDAERADKSTVVQR